MVDRSSVWRSIFLALFLLGSAPASAADLVARFRLTPDVHNADSCGDLDAVLGRIHTIKLSNGDAELTSAGGIEGRMHPTGDGLYDIAFELDGRRLDVTADLTASRKTLVVTERNRDCRWFAKAG